MDNKVDITFSVLLDNAVLEYEKATRRILEELRLPVDIVEVAMEKSLIDLKKRKISLYASAIYESKNSKINEQEEFVENGN